MQEYADDTEDTLSLSNFLIEEDAIDSKQFSNKPNLSSMSTSLSEQDFLGFFTDDQRSNNNTSYTNYSSENIVFCGKVVSSKRPIGNIDGDEKPETKFRSNSDSLSFIRLKTASCPIASRSHSMPNRSSLFKSRLMVFMFGPGSSKFSAKLDMNDIKSRQLRQQMNMQAGWVDGGKEESDHGRTSGKKGWWRLVDVLGCSGGY
ncbi:hypothetical protein R6Q59_008834 [Mikania micrantha]